MSVMSVRFLSRNCAGNFQLREVDAGYEVGGGNEAPSLRLSVSMTHIKAPTIVSRATHALRTDFSFFSLSLSLSHSLLTDKFKLHTCEILPSFVEFLGTI